MISASASQKTGTSATPFDQIAALEKSEKERVEVEITAMQREKDEISQSVAKREEQATDELRTKAKQDLKTYSEEDIGAMLAAAQKDADAECATLEKSAKGKTAEAQERLLTMALDPETYFPSAA